jgi:hypothetical protein
MKRNWSLVALIAGGVLLGGAHGALADRQRERCDSGSRFVRSDWHADRDARRDVHHERLVEVRDVRCDHDSYRAARPFAYVRAADVDHFHHRDCR